MDEPDPSSLLVTNSIEVKRGTSTSSAVVVSVLVVLAGCTFSPQAPVVVEPELVAHQSCAGAGKPVYVSVVDERPTKVLGARGVRGVGAELTAADNCVDSVRDSVSLRAQCALNAICQVGLTRTYDKLFRGEHEESVQVVQGTDANVNQLVDDPELSQCLATQR